MAIYVPQSRRRRNAALVAALTLVLGLGVGYLVGRQAVPSVGSSVRSTLATADDLATQIERLPIEYEQAFAGGDSVATAVVDPLDAIRQRLAAALDGAPWVGADARESAQDAVASVLLAAQDGATPAEFEQTTTKAGAALREAFGVEK